MSSESCLTRATQSIWSLTENILSSSITIWLLRPCIWQMRGEDRQHSHFTAQKRSCGLFHYSVSQMGTFFSLLKCWQCPSDKLILTHNSATHGSAFGWFPRNPVIAACPEMNVGRVDSGYTVQSLWGWGPVGKIKLMVDPSWGCLAKDQSHSPSVGGSFSLTRQSWRLRELTQEMQPLVLLVRTGQSSLHTLSSAHTITSWDGIQPHCTPDILHFNGQRRQDNVR